MGRRGRRRDKQAQKQWLSEKRRGAGGADAEEVRPRPLAAEEDFQSYYDSQGFFGHGPHSAEEQAAFWEALRSPLPVTLLVRNPFAERSLIDLGWERRREFDKAGLSVWEMDCSQYSNDSKLRSWTERENRRGTISFQELVSLVPALLLAPKSGDVCLDLCAAPGNKSLQLLGALTAQGCEGAVLSADNDPQRCCMTLHRVLGKAASPMSCAALANAGHFPVLVEESPCNTQLQCSKILVDVPCSGDGTARKNSQVWRSWSRRDALGLQRLQRQILLRALYLLPPGGVLVYSTCSLNPLENEAVVLSALRKWQSSLGSEGRPKLPVSLLDAVAMCRERCGLQAAIGLCRWRVPAPERRGPFFDHFEEVPEELREDERFPLRPEMFPTEDSLAQDLVRCARFYPHSCDTGAFFVAMIQKSGVCTAGPSSSPAIAQSPIEGRGAHPLLSATFQPISAVDAAWTELVHFYQLDPAWCKEKIEHDLLFWQTMKGKAEPDRVTLVSKAVARLWAAKPSDGRKVAWVRLGVFLFEQLPKGLLSGVASCRWRLHAEGVQILAPILGTRQVELEPALMEHVLSCDHRQATLTEGMPLANAVARGARGRQTEHHHVCGGVLVCMGKNWFPGVLTPKQLRILVDDDTAEAILEQLSLQMPPAPAVPAIVTVPAVSCWAWLATVCCAK